jgi:hypothetical protein
VAERSQFELSGPFERELAFRRQRISLAFVPLGRLKGNGESKAEHDSRENGPKKATFSRFSLPYRQVLTEWRRSQSRANYSPGQNREKYREKRRASAPYLDNKSRILLSGLQL